MDAAPSAGPRPPLAVLAVQAHSSGRVLRRAGVVVSFTVGELLARRWGDAWGHGLTAAGTMVLVEMPYFVNFALSPEPVAAPTLMVDSVIATITHPASIRLGGAFQAVSEASEYILLSPLTLPWFGVPLVTALLITAVRVRLDVVVDSITVVPVLCAVAGFSLWQHAFDHYWFLTIAPSVALTFGLAATAWRPARRIVGPVMAAVLVAAQPARVTTALTLHRLPEYGLLVDASRAIRRDAPEVRRIVTRFTLPETTGPVFLYRVLGGHVTPDSCLVATIHATGEVTYDIGSPAGP